MVYLRTNIKIIIFLLFIIFIFLNAAIEPFIIYNMSIFEFPNSEPMLYQIYASSIFMSFIALCALCIIDFKGLKPKDWVVAIVFGVVVLLPILIYATSANISFAVATFFTYIATVTMRNEYGNRMPIIASTKFLDILVDVSIVAGIILVWFLFVPWSTVELSFSLNPVVLWPLAAATGEEVVFRLFLFYIIVKISKDNNPPFFISLLILVTTSSICHVVGVSMQSGLVYGLSNLYPHILSATLIATLALKRGLLPAILLHFLFNSIQGVIAIY